MDQDFFQLEGIEQMLCPLPFAAGEGEGRGGVLLLLLLLRWLSRESPDPSPSVASRDFELPCAARKGGGLKSKPSRH